MTALEKYIWERLYNPDFNYGEFATIRNQAGLNSPGGCVIRRFRV